MNFLNKNQFNIFLKKLTYLGEGSQGICYLDQSTKTVYKIFHEYFDNESSGYTSNEILKFSDIKNRTFIWPQEIITISQEPIGYTMPYKKAKNFYKTDPLLVNLNLLEKSLEKAEQDIKFITTKGIHLYDVRYNTLYSSGRINIIDTLDYNYRTVTYEENISQLDQEIKLFLVDNYFNHFIATKANLKEMYLTQSVRSKDFLKELRKELSEYLDKDIIKLNDAKKLVKKTPHQEYLRNISK